jgi:hypothetical protein
MLQAIEIKTRLMWRVIVPRERFIQLVKSPASPRRNPENTQRYFLIYLMLERVKSRYHPEGVLMAEQLKPGDYIGLYIDDKLIYTDVLKDQGLMQSGRKIFQILLVKNIFQRNFPEIHFDADIRPVIWQQVQEEIKRLKIKLQKSIEKREGDQVKELITEKELHNIIV